MADDKLQKWFETIFALRDETLYPQFFGSTAPGIYPIPQSTFASLGCGEPDPRFLTHGVFECPPTSTREHWLYVSAGMSNPWGDSPQTANPDGPSGLGYEFVLHSPVRARWPILLLHWLMAVQLLVATGQAKGELLQANDRIPLGGPLAKSDGLLTHLLIASPTESIGYPAEFALPSGRVDLLLVLGITANENQFAKTQDAEALLQLLRHHGIFPLTIPDRLSTM